MNLRDWTVGSTARSATPKMAAVRDLSGPPSVLPMANLVLVEVIVVIGFVVGQLASRPIWYGLGAGVVVAALLVTRVRGQSVLGWVYMRLRFRRRRRRRARGVSWSNGVPFDVPHADDGTSVGFVWDGVTLVSMVRLVPDVHTPTVMEPSATVSGQTFALKIVAECLRQHDIRLASLDVIAHGSRLQGEGDVAATYDAVLGPVAAIAHRSVWIVLRLDPMRCGRAVERRGGGWDVTLKTAAVATRRVVNRLSANGLRAQIVTAAGIDAATRQITEGIDPGRVEETWTVCRWGRLEVRSFGVVSEALTTDGLGSVWTIPSYSTTVTTSMRADESDGDRILSRAVVTLVNEGQSPSRLSGLYALNGQQFDGWVNGLPLVAAQESLGRWGNAAAGDALEGVRISTSGCGQLLGADENGRAVALTLFGVDVDSVDIDGTLHLVQQIVLRSLALGARVRVHSNRSEQWRSMAAQVGDFGLLHVVDAVAQQQSPEAVGSQYNVELFDDVEPRPVLPGVTVWRMSESQRLTAHTADVLLQLIDHEFNTIQVRTGAGTTVVNMVTTQDEMRYLKTPFSQAS